MDSYLKGALGVPVGPPGTTTDLRRGNRMNLPSAGVPGFDGIMPNSLGNGRSTLGYDSMVNDRRHDNQISSSQNEVTVQFVLNPFPDGREKFTSVGDPVFAVRSKKSSSGTTTIVTLACFNNVLREGYAHGNKVVERYQQHVNQGRSGPQLLNLRAITADSIYSDDPVDRKAFIGTADLIRKIREDDENASAPEEITSEADELKMVLNDYANSRNANPTMKTYLEKQLKIAIAKQISREETVKFWREFKDKDVNGAKFLTLGYIMRKYNFLGIVSTSTNQVGVLHEKQYSGSGNAVQISVIKEKKCHTMFNYWGNTLRKMDYLWFIIKRIRSDTGIWGPYQCIPWSKGKERPGVEDVRCVDYFGNEEMGAVIFVGSINTSLRGVVVPLESMKTAAGLIPGKSLRDCYATQQAHLRMFEGSVQI